MRMTKSLLTVSIMFLLTAAVLGCATASAGGVVQSTRNGEASGPLGDFPATFEGELPCADCPGIFYHLDLFEDGVFFLRTTYLGRGTGAILDNVGSWTLAGDERRLALFGDWERPMLFHIVDPETLRKLDVEGRAIESSLNYDLRRKDAIGTIEPRFTMRGMYSYMADAALFEECISGRRFQVAQEADNLALERAYLEAQRQPGEALLVSLQGRITERPAMEGDALVLTVVPEHFIGVWPGETCGARMTTSELFGTRWELTRLGDEPIVLAENQRAPNLVLYSKDHRVSGFGGCNRFNGSFEIDGRSITFSPMAATMMACIPGGDTERAFLAALGKVTSFLKTAHHLEFLDGDGTIVARFEARDLE
jgi:copper homeostasis protein (lipoprotein)